MCGVRTLRSAALVVALLLGGCATLEPEPEPVEIAFATTQYGVLYPLVDGVAYQPTFAEERAAVLAVLKAYDCAVTDTAE